ncbi:MAG: hypothetical protein E4H36_00045 [Spirochaetales bacterium]|nr:MAG: hypothetical protein E4H36_00045 [Spirochaetales bacterium]
MVKSELIKRSPLRILENTIHGGLGKGNIGIIASRKGVGKTACLVHISTDKLLQGKHVVHVSFSSKTDYIIDWYEDIFKEIAKKRDLENAVEVHDELIQNRVIMNFNQDGVTMKQILSSLEAMISGGNFAAEAVVVDGYDFSRASTDSLEQLKAFAEKLGLEVWISASLKGEEPLFDENGLPVELKQLMLRMSIIITLRYVGDHVQFNLVKDHDTFPSQDMNLKLDPKTLLIAEQ